MKNVGAEEFAKQEKLAMGGQIFDKDLAPTPQLARAELEEFFADGEMKRPMDMELAMLGGLTPFEDILRGRMLFNETIYQPALQSLIDDGVVEMKEDAQGWYYRRGTECHPTTT